MKDNFRVISIFIFTIVFLMFSQIYLYSKPLLLEKITIIKRDGSTVEAWLVDYDDNSYTFRLNPKKIAEFTLLKKDISSFQSDYSPGDITTTANITNIKIKWGASLKYIKIYRIYYKLKDQIEYKSAGESKKLDFILNKLKSNTEYEIKVESETNNGFILPGKSIVVKTLNAPPSKPGKIKYELTSDKRKILLSWESSNDNDGEVKGYKVYKYDGMTGNKIKTTPSPNFNYELKNIASKQQFYVKAYDDQNFESEETLSQPIYFDYYNITFEALYFNPTGDFSNLFGSGYGGILTFSLNNYSLYGLTIGAETGYFNNSSGKSYDLKEYKSFSLVPVILYSGYKLLLNESIMIEPLLGFGYCYIDMEYTTTTEKFMTNDLTPVVKGGVHLSYIMNDINYGIGLFYYGIIESDQIYSFYTISLGAGYMF